MEKTSFMTAYNVLNKKHPSKRGDCYIHRRSRLVYVVGRLWVFGLVLSLTNFVLTDRSVHSRISHIFAIVVAVCLLWYLLQGNIWKNRPRFIATKDGIHFPCNGHHINAWGFRPGVLDRENAMDWLFVPWFNVKSIGLCNHTNSDMVDYVSPTLALSISDHEKRDFFKHVLRPDYDRAESGLMRALYVEKPQQAKEIVARLVKMKSAAVPEKPARMAVRLVFVEPRAIAA